MISCVQKLLNFWTERTIQNLSVYVDNISYVSLLNGYEIVEPSNVVLTVTVMRYLCSRLSSLDLMSCSKLSLPRWGIGPYLVTTAMVDLSAMFIAMLKSW